MTLKNLKKVRVLLSEYSDFFDANSDGDETGYVQEINSKHVEVEQILKDESFKLHLRNELAKRRNINKKK
jgi:hypothetical protein